MIRNHKTIVGWAIVLSIGGIVFGTVSKVHYRQQVPLFTVQGTQLKRAQTTVAFSPLTVANNRTLPVVPTIASIPIPPPTVVRRVVAVTQLPPSSPSYTVPPTTITTLPGGTGTTTPPAGGSGQKNSGPPNQADCQQYNTGFASTNWAGYGTNSGGYTSVSGTWKATSPTGVANLITTDSTWVGIGGWGTPDLIQAGTTNFIKSDGTLSSWAWYEMLPAASVPVITVPVNGGDTIQVTIQQVSSGRWSISIDNQTTHNNFTTTVSYASSLATAEWIEEEPNCDPTHQFPLDNFSSVTFTNGSAVRKGQTLTIAGTQAVPITLANAITQKPVATPSSLGSDGASFTVTQQ